MESLQQELLNEGDVVRKRRKGPAEILRQIALKLSDDLGAGGVRRPLAGHFTTPFSQSMVSSRCNVFGSPPAKALLPATRPQKSIHDPGCPDH